MSTLAKREVTIDVILDWFKTVIREGDEETDRISGEVKKRLTPEMWINAAMKVNVLLDDEIQDCVRAELAYKSIQVREIQAGKTGIAAKMIAEGSEEYQIYREKAARIDVCKEMIRLAKKQAALQSFTM